MMSSPDWNCFSAACLRPGRLALIALLSSGALLVGCLEKKTDSIATQTAAKVNSEEITVHQINFALQQQRGLKPEQTDAAGRQILERLIDQELALQKAKELQLDRDPRVVQLLEVARREIVARAFLEKAGSAAAKPSAEDIKKYYDEHPALFSARRIYTLQELAIEAKPEQVAGLREQLGASKSINEFTDFLKSNNYRFASTQALRTAEQLPLNMLDTFARMSDGQAMLAPTSIGAQVVVLAGSRSEPVDEARAKPVIEQYLLNDAKRKLAEAELKTLRSAAKIEYVGTFANVAAAAASAAEASPPLSGVATPAASSAQDGATLPLDPESVGKGLGLK